MKASSTCSESMATGTSAKSKNQCTVSASTLLVVMAMVVASGMLTTVTYVGNADNFTDIFYTNSFRGAFTWIQKLDWVGMLVQMVISCFSLFGVALMTIRIMTSMLYLSSKGLWEEVHDLKQTSGESELYDLGILNMAKTWAKGKAGTGLDAIIGAILILLPDVKKYSDFGEKAKGDFDENITISQYMLKILLPTIMTVFFFAMGFNGTLFQFLAVTVDAMGMAADKAISINYAGFVEDLVNSGTGYNFVFKSAGTNIGELQQNIAKDIYGRAVSELSGADAEQLYVLGKNVENIVGGYVTTENIASVPDGQIAISTVVRQGLAGESTSSDMAQTPDNFVPNLGYEIVVNGSPTAVGAYMDLPIQGYIYGRSTGGAVTEPTCAAAASRPETSEVPRMTDAYQETQTKYMHVFIKQTSSYNGTYFNLDGTSANN